MVQPQAWVGQPPKASRILGTGGLLAVSHPKTRPNSYQSGSIWYSYGEFRSFSGDLPVFPNELPDPFGESPSELSARSHGIVRIRPNAQA
ncbi:hypothetical protein GW17_00053481 [Ensete ventricosum]|nr:hypothetical protein GW17_00053481 [Ensete ventricosum]RZS07974.1 hypothetical protein BHM03_00038893 [Ensete ventricosum]